MLFSERLYPAADSDGYRDPQSNSKQSFRSLTEEVEKRLEKL